MSWCGERYNAVRLHLLMTEELKARFQELGEQENVDNPVVITKYYSRHTPWVWYPISYNAPFKMFYGYIAGYKEELCYFSLGELAQQLIGGYPLNRDTLFKETTLNEIKEKLKRKAG